LRVAQHQAGSLDRRDLWLAGHRLGQSQVLKVHDGNHLAGFLGREFTGNFRDHHSADPVDRLVAKLGDGRHFRGVAVDKGVDGAVRHGVGRRGRTVDVGHLGGVGGGWLGVGGR